MALLSPFRRSAAIVATALGAGTLLTTPQEAEAAIRNVSGDLRVTQISNGFNGSDISVGTLGHYSFTVDTATPDSDLDPESATYFNAVKSSSISFGNVVFTTDMSNLGRSEIANTELFDFINFIVTSPSLVNGNVGGLLVDSIGADFAEIGDSPVALSNDFITDALHDTCLSQLTTIRQISMATAGGNDVVIAQILNFHVTDIPSPGSVAIVLPAAALLAARRKERAPSTAAPAAAL